MFESWQIGLLVFLRTISQILTAGIAITAFSLLLHVLTFNLRDRVIYSFVFILACVVIGFTGEAIGNVVRDPVEIEIWLRLQWLGIILLPVSYLQFSDSLLAITGKPSRWRRVWAVRAAYAATFAFLFTLVMGYFIGGLVLTQQPAPHLKPNLVTAVFVVFYAVIMAMSWFNFARAYRRTTTPTSRRRMGYLVIGAFGPAIGSFPFLLFSSTFAAQHPLLFWFVAFCSNLLLGGLVVVMAYAVAFFGVAWPDRVIKSRILKWIMRGPVTASFTLAVVTVARRMGVVLNFDTSTLLPIAMTLTVLLCEYTITIFAPYWEQWFFFEKDRADLEMVRDLQDRLLTQNDLRQFLEMLLAAVCDNSQAKGAYIAVFNGEGVDLLVSMGKPEIEALDRLEMVANVQDRSDLFRRGEDYFFPLVNGGEGTAGWYGLLGITSGDSQALDEEQIHTIILLAHRATLALRDRKIQQQSFQMLQNLAPEVDMIQLLRAQGRYDTSKTFQERLLQSPEEMSLWVKEALTHYWGGPKLTDSPLMKLQIVQDALDEHDSNSSNALRAILRKAIEQTRPEGERRFTGDWILYNILEMKFLEGRKVREVASRLALSEADLYRKQRVAIETVSRVILEMEEQAHLQISSEAD
jgi:hypothetical protein